MTIQHKSLDFLVTTLWYLHVVNMVPNISTYFSGLQVNVPDYSRSISNSITFQSLKNQKFNSTTKGKHIRSGSRHRCRLSKWKLIFQMSCTKVRCLTAIRFTADQLTTNTKQSPSMPRRIFLRPRSRRTCLATSRFSMYLKKRYSDVLWITWHVHTQPVISKHTSQQQFYTLPHIYINPLMGTLILHSNGPLYNNTVILHWPLMGGLYQIFL